MSCLADSEMELRIGLHSGLPSTDCFGLFIENFFHAIDVSFCRPLGCQRGDVRFNELAHFKDICQRILFFDEKFSQRRDQGFDRADRL